jgi:opacity protein-like surface antigen
MKRILLAAVAATALSASASAGGLQFNCRSTSYYGTYNGGCSLEDIKDPKKLTEEEIAALKVEDDKWLAFCKPVRQPDDEGVIRLRYAHKGCEFGRSE